MNKKQQDLASGMAAIFLLILLAFLAAILSGCAAQKQLAKNLQEKSIFADGFVAVNKITVTDPASSSVTPELKSVFVSGKFLSLLKSANFLAYDRRKSASTFNSSAATETESLIIQTDDPGKIAEILRLFGEKTLADPPPRK